MDLVWAIGQLEAGAAAIAALTSGLRAGAARSRPDATNWSIVEVLCHLADVEWPPIDPERWVDERAYNSRTLSAALDDFQTERGPSLIWLRQFDEPDFTPIHRRGDGSRLRAGDLLTAWVAHDLLHVRQLVALRYWLVQQAATPYSPTYAGDWCGLCAAVVRVLYCSKSLSFHNGATSMASIPVPTIIERSARGERAWDIFSRMMQERVIMISTPIDDEMASLVVAQLLVLQHQDPQRDVWLYINSPGGVIRAGLAIYDTMQLITPDVCTVCVGRAASMATVLLCGGAKGKRYALPNATIHSHPAGGGAEGYAPDVQIAVNEMLRLQRMLREIMAKHSGQSLERIERDFNRDAYLNAQQAIEYGLIDAILEPQGSQGRS